MCVCVCVCVCVRAQFLASFNSHGKICSKQMSHFKHIFLMATSGELPYLRKVRESKTHEPTLDLSHAPIAEF